MSEENINTIKQTAQLLYVFITPEKEKEITHSFEKLLGYFKVMDLASTDFDNACDTDTLHDETYMFGVLRDDSVKSYENTQALVERSEEHDAEYIVIPTVL